MAADQRGVVANRTCAWVGDTLLCACARLQADMLSVSHLDHHEYRVCPAPCAVTPSSTGWCCKVGISEPKVCCPICWS